MNAKSLYLTESDSIASFVPILLEQLKRNKYVLVKTNFARDDDRDKVTRNLLLYAGILGQHLGRSLGHYVLSGHGDTSLLPVHVEGI